jgi:hypothetical protein
VHGGQDALSCAVLAHTCRREERNCGGLTGFGDTDPCEKTVLLPDAPFPLSPAHLPQGSSIQKPCSDATSPGSGDLISTGNSLKTGAR